MMNRRKEAGLTVLGWLVVLLVVGAAASISVKVIPHYVDNQTIVSVLESMPKNKVHTMSKAEIRTSVIKRLKINNIRDIDIQSIMKIERARGSTTLALNYEVREHLLGNMDIVMSFKRNFVFTAGGTQ